MIFDYEGVKRVLSDYETFSSRHGPAEWLAFMDPPRQAKLRALISRAFTPRMVANLEPRIRRLAIDLLEPVMAKGEMDVATDFAGPLPMIVICGMLGIPASNHARFKLWSDIILDMSYTVPGNRDDVAEAAWDAFVTVTNEMDEYLDAQLHQRRGADAPPDLLTSLARAEVDGQRLTRQEILGFFQLLLVAGQETTTNLINNAIICFIDHPDEFARLRSRMALLPSAIEEVLRFRSPVQWMFRLTTRDVDFSGQTIPSGRVVLAMIGSANRDAKVFDQPDRFDIARDPNPHLAFGHGIHFCMGAPLARLEASITLTELLKRVDRFERAGTEPWKPRKALHVHGPTHLPIRFARL
jgi:cytochrome P450